MTLFYFVDQVLDHIYPSFIFLFALFLFSRGSIVYFHVRPYVTTQS